MLRAMDNTSTPACESSARKASASVAATAPFLMSSMSFFGLSGFCVFHAGQRSWQRPHSVHTDESSSIFHDASFSWPTPKVSSSSTLPRSTFFAPEVIGLSAPSAFFPSALRWKKMLNGAAKRCQATPQPRWRPTKTRKTMPVSSFTSAKMETSTGEAGSSVAMPAETGSVHRACPKVAIFAALTSSMPRPSTKTMASIAYAERWLEL